MLGPILRGEKITLEPVSPDDLPLFCRWFADPAITRYLLVRFAFSMQQEEEWYANAARSDDSVHWSIRAEGRTIGSTAIHNIEWINRTAKHGTVIGEREAWGRGYGSEVVRLRTAFAFDDLGLERLETETFAENVAMQRALEKAGYTAFGRRRSRMYKEGRRHDTILYELLREDWLGSRWSLVVSHRSAHSGVPSVIASAMYRATKRVQQRAHAKQPAHDKRLKTSD